MAITIAQTATGSGFAGATFASTPTLGNVIVGHTMSRGDAARPFATGASIDTSFTEIARISGSPENAGNWVGAKVVNDTQASFHTLAYANSHADSVVIYELAGMFGIDDYELLTVPHDTTHLRSFDAGDYVAAISGSLALASIMYYPDGPWPGITDPTGWTQDYDTNTLSVRHWNGHIAGAGSDIPTAFSIPSNGYNEKATNAIFVLWREGTAPPDASVADFVGVPTSGTSPLAVQFTDLSDPTPTSWAWTFGDGGTSTEQNPLHIYTAPGVYDVSLTVDGGGGSPVPNVIDDFENRTNADDDPDSGSYGGEWAISSSGPEWDVSHTNFNTWVGVSGGVGTFTREQRPAPPDPGAPGMAMGEVTSFLYPITPPIDDEPVLSFKFRTPAAIPDDSSDGGGGNKGPLRIGVTWGTDGAAEDLEVGIWICSASGKGGLAVSFPGTNDTVDGDDTFAKLDWIADTLYVLEAQYLHDGTIQARVYEDGGSVPSFQASYASGNDYGTWTLDGYLNIQVESFNDYEVSTGTVESQLVEFDDIEMGTVGASTSVTKTEYITVLAGASSSILPYYRDRLLLLVRASYTDDKLFNHALVTATGNKAQIFYGEASDTDPDSPTRIEAIGDRVISLETDLITNQASANKAAKKLFLDNCLVSEDVQIEALCNPALEGNDVVGVQELTFSQVENTFRLQALTVPLSTSRQRLRMSRVIDLQTQTISTSPDILFIDASTAARTTIGTSVSIDVPAAAEDGDLLLAYIGLDEGGVESSPTISGTWHSVTGTGRFKWRFASSEPATRTVSWSGSRKAAVAMLAYRNVDPTNPIAGLIGTNRDEDTTVLVDGLTLPSGEYHLVGAVEANYGNIVYTWPAGWTEQAEIDTDANSGDDVSVGLGDKPFVGANPKSFYVTSSKAYQYRAFQVALRKYIA